MKADLDQKAGHATIGVVIFEDGHWDQIGMQAELANSGDIEIVGMSTDPVEILNLVETKQPKVAIIDICIYNDCTVGPSVIRAIKNSFPEVKCVVPTAFAHELRNIQNVLEAGADAIIIKGARPPRPSLPELVRLVTAGGRYYDPDITIEIHREGLRLRGEKREIEDQGKSLTERERDVLQCIQLGSSTDEIGSKLGISPSTVKFHIGRILEKTGTRSRDAAVLSAISRGWLDEPSKKKD